MQLLHSTQRTMAVHVHMKIAVLNFQWKNWCNNFGPP